MKSFALQTELKTKYIVFVELKECEHYGNVCSQTQCELRFLSEDLTIKVRSQCFGYCNFTKAIWCLTEARWGPLLLLSDSTTGCALQTEGQKPLWCTPETFWWTHETFLCAQETYILSFQPMGTSACSSSLSMNMLMSTLQSLSDQPWLQVLE